MTKAAVFDLDGVLLDSMGIWNDLGARYLRSLGVTPEEGLNEILFSMSMEQGAEYLHTHYALPQSAAEVGTGIADMLRDFYFYEVPAKDGAAALLAALTARGVKLAAATSSPREHVTRALERLGLLGYFTRLFTTAEVGVSKHKPTIYLLAAEALHAAPAETLVFEDSLYALKTAKAAGFYTIGVYDADGETDQAGLQRAADLYVRDLHEAVWLQKKSIPQRYTGGTTLCRFIKPCCIQKGKEVITMRTALTIAGSDSSGGAGIQADIKTMTANGVFALCAVTALTAQNTTGVTDIFDSTPHFLAEQLDAVFTDIFPDAVKIGMVSSAELIETIAAKLKEYGAKHIVVDPVMVATSGAKLLRDDAVTALCEKLLPLAEVLTPNIPEAEILSGMTIQNAADMERAAQTISEKYGCAVLCKGGHQINDADDLLWRGGAGKWFKGRRIDNPNTHGTGCTLSSAIASNLAKGYDLDTSVERAKAYISGALAAMLDLGHGSGPMNHMFALKGDFVE